MLDAGGGGGGTPWESMTIPAMQTLIQNPDTEKHWNLVNGWTKSADLVNEHRSQVQNYRDNLAAAWPPERSTAAAAYLTRLDTLIASLTETYEAALANYDAFSAATLSLSLAQTEMQKIFDEHQVNEQLLLDFKTQQEAKQNSPTPQPSPSPSGEQPPIPPGRQEELHRRAATLLSGVSTELAQAQMRLVTPRPYKPTRDIDEQKAINDGNTFIPPVIPPIAAAPVLSDGTSSQTPRTPTTFPTSASPSVPAPIATSPSAQQPGLVLGAASPLPATSPPTAGFSLSPPPPPGGTGVPIATPGSLAPIGGSYIPRGGTNVAPLPLSPGNGRVGGFPPEGMVRTGGSTLGGPHAMPPGGVIGGIPGTGLGQPAATRPGPQRINPVGGVIGGPAGSTPNRRGNPPSERMGSFGSSPLASQSRNSQRGRAEIERWDPNNPWETTEGVAPVVLPPRERRIDPGPAIGLD